MDYILPKSNILRGYQTFSRVISKGLRLQSNHLVGYIAAQSAERPKVLIGFSVAKKQIPLAVDRNRIRRLMREAIRKHIAELKMDAEKKKLIVEIVLSFRGSGKNTAKTISLREIESEWIQLLQQMPGLL